MAMKPEPMEFEGENTGMFIQAQIYPMQLIQNETQGTTRTLQMEHHSVSHSTAEAITDRNNSFPSNSTLNQNCMINDDPSKMFSLQTRHRSTVSEILLGGQRQSEGSCKNYQNSYLQPYTIARGELELNSKFLPKKYKCGMCVYKTSYKSDLNRHMRRHSSNKEVPSCRNCNLTFSTQSSLLVHNKKCPLRRGATPGSQIQLGCALCPYSTSYKSDLNRHMKCHYSYEFACDICNKPFKVFGMVDHHRQSAHDIQTSVYAEGNKNTSSAVNPYRQWTVGDTERQDAVCLQDMDNSFDDSSASPLLQMKRKSNKQSYNKTNHEHSLSEDCVLIDDSNDTNSVSESAVGLPPAEETLSVPGTVNRPQHISALMNTYTSETEKQYPEDGDNIQCSTPDISKTQLQKQSRVRELLSLNSSKQSTVTLSIKQFCCEKCNGIFASIRKLLHHKKSCLQKKFSTAYRCTLCTFMTCNTVTFKKHKRKHSTAAYSCECCNQPFLIERNLIKHKLFCRWSARKISGSTGTAFPKSGRNRTNCSDDTIEETHGVSNSVFIPRTDSGNVGLDVHHLSTEKQMVKNRNSHKSAQGDIQSHPPETGRYARLISDFDEFSRKPYSCSLCFFRTANTGTLVKHVENHLTGCNWDPIPESARFSELQQIYQPQGQNIVETPLSYSMTKQYREHGGDFALEKTNSHYAIQRESVTSNAVVSAKARYRINPPSFRNRYLWSGSRGIGTTRSRLTRAFACRMCNKRFSVRALLVRHVKKFHKD